MNEEQGEMFFRTIPLLDSEDAIHRELLEELCAKNGLTLDTMIALAQAAVKFGGKKTGHALFQRFDEIFDTLE